MNDLIIKNMGNDIQAYLEKEKLTDGKPKHLMPFLIEKGYFKKDHRDGLPLRNMLRELDLTNRLHLLPQVRADRKNINVSWYFNPVQSFFVSNVLNYLDQNKKILFNRYNSWNHCYGAFGGITDSKVLSLHLGFYLASWGMYRGSGQLLQNDYLIHEGAVQLINEFRDLRCSPEREVDHKDIERISELISRLKTYYSNLDVTPTNILLSKIILGTLGCLPAFDRYFCDGVKHENDEFGSLTKKSLEKLFDFMEDKKTELKQIQNQHSEYYYPNMKLIDMYFWEIGFEMDKK